MSEFRHRLAGNLSGGMKQKLGLACALIHTPRVLLLDEPTTGVDPISRREFWAMLYSLLGQGVTVLVSTSYLDEAERCHRLALLHEGRLLICDEPARLKARFAASVLSVISREALRVKGRLTGGHGISSAIVVGDAVHLFNPPQCAPDFTHNYNVTSIDTNVTIANLGGGPTFDTWSTISVLQ